MSKKVVRTAPAFALAATLAACSSAPPQPPPPEFPKQDCWNAAHSCRLDMTTRSIEDRGGLVVVAGVSDASNRHAYAETNIVLDARNPHHAALVAHIRAHTSQTLTFGMRSVQKKHGLFPDGRTVSFQGPADWVCLNADNYYAGKNSKENAEIEQHKVCTHITGHAEVLAPRTHLPPHAAGIYPTMKDFSRPPRRPDPLSGDVF